MSMYKDFIAFVDSGAKVPYFMDNCTYVPRPYNIDEVFNYEQKTFYKSSHKYYVGVPFSDFVREITSQDYKMMKKLKNDSCTYKNSTKELKQLVFDF